MKLVHFTDEQLYEIEKVFDNLASQNLAGFTKISDTFLKTDLLEKRKENEKAREMFQKITSSACEYYDMVRTISAICQKARQAPLKGHSDDLLQTEGERKND